VVVVNLAMRPTFLVPAFAALLFAGQALAQSAVEQRCAKGDGYDAITACSDIIGIGLGGPDVAWAYFDRARAYFDLKLYASAIDDLNVELKLKPDDIDALENRGLAQIEFGDLKSAVHDFNKVIDARPASEPSLRGRCWARGARNDDLDEALDDCNKALALEPGNAATLDARCLVQFRKAAYAPAIADCSAALTADPKLATALYLRGLAKKKSGDAAGAQADIDAARAIKPEIGDWYANYGVGP